MPTRARSFDSQYELHVTMTAKTNAERQRQYRDRKAQEGETEIRGIYAHPDDHQAVKAYAERLARKRKKSNTSPK